MSEIVWATSMNKYIIIRKSRSGKKMSREHSHTGVLFYARTDERHITVESGSQKLKPDIKVETPQDPLEIFLARDIANSPIIVAEEDAPLDKVAQLMAKGHVGCIVVINKEEKPLGMMTEGDLIARVFAKDISPNKMTARDVMTSPLITIKSEMPIYEVARVMNQHRIGRLGVIYKGTLVGIISKKDIVELLPKMTTILQETQPWTRQ